MSTIRLSVVLGLFTVGCAADPAAQKGFEAGEVNETEQSEDLNTVPVGELAGGMTLMDLTAGSFSMGSADTDERRYYDEALHTVELSGEVEMGVTEVTQLQFREYMGYDAPDMFVGCDDCPVQNVSWDEAAAFTNALSVSHELETCYTCDGDARDIECEPVEDLYACNGYRLPTEAEWEYASRAGAETIYSGGDNLDEYGWYYYNSSHQIQPVASLRPNAWGLYDMSGNVREFTHDWYSEFEEGAILVDPVVHPADGERPIERGGSYDCIPDHLRIQTRIMHMNSDMSHDADRDRDDFDREDDDAPGEIGSRVRDVHVGFRVARSIH
mgnify:CR=1 FL=1